MISMNNFEMNFIIGIISIIGICGVYDTTSISAPSFTVYLLSDKSPTPMPKLMLMLIISLVISLII